MLRALRFYHVVDASPWWLVVLTLAFGSYAVIVASSGRSGVDEGLAVALLWQMLSASTGFLRMAAAGHLDPILVTVRRPVLVLAHFLYAAAPGVLLWIGVTLVEVVRLPPPYHSLEIARIAAFLFVTAAAWSFSLALPRMAFGALWLLGIVVAATTKVGVDWYAALAAKDAGSAGELLHAAAMAIACPFVLIGDVMPAREAAAAALSVLSIVTLAAAVALLTRRDYPLEAS